ncbi:MAG: hypothetical protein Kow0089_24190 [Desulfobulbaceae bacterium]
MEFRRVGIVGVPPLRIITELNRSGCRILDLDEPLVNKSIELSSPWLPRVYCAILRTVVVNVLHLELDAIYIDVGPGKCDCALHVATVLEEILTIPVIRTENRDDVPFGTPVCRARIPLLEKFRRITGSVRTGEPAGDFEPCLPEAGFWGVPPRDFSILEPFPDTTHIYGWTRCMENKTPADMELEMYCNPEVPTVFFAQSFCAKTALAGHLARLHPCSLFVDCDVTAGSSARAKIEAFLELSVAGKCGGKDR